MTHVLVADDDPLLATFLTNALGFEGMEVETSCDGAGALAALAAGTPDILLLDLGLPDLPGLEVLDAVRRTREHLPVIIISGRRHEDDRVGGLDRGADDYLMKPFTGRELAARIRSVLRRTHRAGRPAPAARHLLIDGDLTIDPISRRVTAADRPVELTKREFELLHFLVTNPGRVFSRKELLAEVWASSEEWQVPATVTEHVRRIRLKLRPSLAADAISNVRGVGYRYR